MTHFSYVLICSDGTYYVGYTNNLSRRLEEHKTGHGSRYTKGRLPVRLVYYEILSTISQGLKRESQIKRLSRVGKERLISHVPICCDTPRWYPITADEKCIHWICRSCGEIHKYWNHHRIHFDLIPPTEDTQ